MAQSSRRLHMIRSHFDSRCTITESLHPGVARGPRPQPHFISTPAGNIQASSLTRQSSPLRRCSSRGAGGIPPSGAAATPGGGDEVAIVRLQPDDFDEWADLVTVGFAEHGARVHPGRQPRTRALEPRSSHYAPHTVWFVFKCGLMGNFSRKGRRQQQRRMTQCQNYISRPRPRLVQAVARPAPLGRGGAPRDNGEPVRRPPQRPARADTGRAVERIRVYATARCRFCIWTPFE
jgi:hypothetical protein